MDSQDLRNVYEFYNNLYEQQIGVPLKDASDRSAKEQLQKMIPKGEKVHTPKSSLQNAAYEPEGDSIEEDIRTRDVTSRSGFDPRFDKRSTTTTTSRPTTQSPSTTTSRPTTQSPTMQSGNSGGLLGKLDTFARDTAGRVGEVIGQNRGQQTGIPGGGFIGGMVGRNRAQGMYDRAKQTVGGLLKQDYEPDMFDIILEYLVAEGYADTNQAAIAIMANMSEEWKQSIVEQSLSGRAAAVVDDQRRGSHGAADDLNKTRKSLDKMKAYPNGFPNAAGVKGA